MYKSSLFSSKKIRRQNIHAIMKKTFGFKWFFKSRRQPLSPYQCCHEIVSACLIRRIASYCMTLAGGRGREDQHQKKWQLQCHLWLRVGHNRAAFTALHSPFFGPRRILECCSCHQHAKLCSLCTHWTRCRSSLGISLPFCTDREVWQQSHPDLLETGPKLVVSQGSDVLR